jgi:hypothetical protein
MGISIFPAPSASTNNDFVVDMNNTTNNTAELASNFIAGSYAITLASGDTTFDVYLIKADGTLVGYSKTNSIVASDGFNTVVILGVSATEIVNFTFTGPSTNATAAGQEVTAGAYLKSVSPSNLATTDATATVLGGNFSTAVQINFTSGTVSTAAKNIVRTNSTALVITRPDSLPASLNPWSLEAINPGVTPPTGSNAHILAGTITGGSGVVWTTTSPLTTGTVNSAYAGTLVATDADGAVTYSITAGTFPGLSLNSTTGVLSGTPTAAGTATVRASDTGGNTADRQFVLPLVLATGGSITTVNGFTTHTFTTSGNFVALATIPSAQYLVIAGGGGGGSGVGAGVGGGGGGGGYLSSISGETGAGGSAVASAISISAGTVAITVGAAGNGGLGNNGSGGNQGGSSTIAGFATAIGGGAGGAPGGGAGGNGGSGGGGGSYNTNSGTPAGAGGTGTAGQGFNGGTGGGASNTPNSGAGGGAGGAGAAAGTATAGISSSATGTAVTYAQGGGGAQRNISGGSQANNAGSGGGGGLNIGNGGAGIAGLVIVRY